MLIPSFISSCRILVTGTIILLFSCNRLQTEADAIKLNQKGIDYMNDGNYELALTEFTNAIKNPKLSKRSKGTIYRNIGLTYQELKKTDSSVHYYSIAAKSYRKNSYDYLVNMSSVELLTGKTKMALSKLNRAVTMNPEDLVVNNALGLIYLGDYGYEFTNPVKALHFNKKAFEISSTRITEDILGRNYYDVGNYEMAELHYEKIHDRYPENLTYTLNTGLIKFKLKKKLEADLLFSKVLTADSTYRETIELFKMNNR